MTVENPFTGNAVSPGLPADPKPWTKVDLIHALADIHGYRSLLEISTSWTGFSYPSVDRSRFETCRRLSYLTPDDWNDGAPIDYRSTDRDTASCLRQIREQGLRFDIVFVDPFHEYEITRRDIDDALALVNDGGVVIAHDCLPDDGSISTPVFPVVRIAWYGVSYKYYIDLLTSRDDLCYCAVDTDCGCAMIRKGTRPGRYRRAKDVDAALIDAWRSIGDDYAAAYRMYERHRTELLNVVTVEEFLAGEKLGARG